MKTYKVKFYKGIIAWGGEGWYHSANDGHYSFLSGMPETESGRTNEGRVRHNATGNFYYVKPGIRPENDNREHTAYQSDFDPAGLAYKGWKVSNKGLIEIKVIGGDKSIPLKRDGEGRLSSV